MLDMMDTYNYNTAHHQYDKFLNHQDGTRYTKYMTKKMHVNSLNKNLVSDACRVCGFNQNTGRNFGVITCSTCKAFFRRNGRHASSLPLCRFGGHCPVNERTRRQCPSCRLAKCFLVGMQKDLIRTDEERAARLQLVKANRLQKREKSSPQLQQQQQHISYEIHDKYQQIKKYSSPILSTNYWIQLTNIHNAYEHFCLYPILRAEEEREEYLNILPIKYRLKEHSFLNVLKIYLTSLNNFFSSIIPEYSIEMNENDRQWLIQTNLRFILLFSSINLMNINGNEIYFDRTKACHNVYLYVYGQDLVKQADYLIRKLNHLIGFDPIISKIMQIILFLAPCLVTNYFPSNKIYLPSLYTILHIVHSQEQYTQILWAYLVYRYGEIEAQRLFLSLIGQVLQQQKYGADVDKSLYERQPFENLVYSLLTTYPID